MPTRSLDSLTLKILSFLKSVGMTSDPVHPDDAALMARVEQEYGISLMSFLESEWLHEQLTRDELSEEVVHARELLNPERRRSFDEDLALLFSR